MTDSDQKDPMDTAVSEYTNKYGLSREEVPVKIQCPTCKKTGNVFVDKELVLTSPGNVMRYPVTGGVICEHAFMVVIDVNFKAR